jgi:small subunit ribosomal protein S17
VISISNGWRVSKQVHHVVNHIIAPYGEPIEARPAVPTLEERLNAERIKRLEKDARRGVSRRWEWEGDVTGWKKDGKAKGEAVLQS